MEQLSINKGNKQNVTNCASKGNIYYGDYVAYTLNELKKITNDLGLKQPKRKTKEEYCKLLSEHNNNIYKWSREQINGSDKEIKELKLNLESKQKHLLETLRQLEELESTNQGDKAKYKTQIG